MRADQALGLVAPHGWDRRSAGATGPKGPRYCDWAFIVSASPRRHLLIRRSIRTGELAYYLARVPEHYVVSLTDLVKVAGTRWAIEDDFQDWKQAVALDGTQVCSYTAWKRHTTIAMAYAVLAVTAARSKAAHPAPVLPANDEQLAPADCGAVALTVSEIQRFLPVLLGGHGGWSADVNTYLAWSAWRRRHQAPRTLAPLPPTLRAHRLPKYQITKSDCRTG